MMTPEKAKVVSNVYKSFSEVDNSNTEWDEIDEKMSYLEWLKDEEIVNESTFIAVSHMTGRVRCNSEGCVDCAAPTIVEAVSYILELYKETKYLPPQNRYVLAYYLTVTHLGFIISEEIK